MARSLKISVPQAKRIAAIFELQGYIKPETKGTWITTLSGQEVSGAKNCRASLLGMLSEHWTISRSASKS